MGTQNDFAKVFMSSFCDIRNEYIFMDKIVEVSQYRWKLHDSINIWQVFQFQSEEKKYMFNTKWR